MTDYFWTGMMIGFCIGGGLWWWNLVLYKRILASIGDRGGSEKICGRWYRIEREDGGRE